MVLAISFMAEVFECSDKREYAVVRDRDGIVLNPKGIRLVNDTTS